MTAYFADTGYYLALLNARDEHHAAAGALTSQLQGSIVTTAWVLTEVADAFCRPGPRDIAAAFLRDLLTDTPGEDYSAHHGPVQPRATAFRAAPR